MNVGDYVWFNIKDSFYWQDDRDEETCGRIEKMDINETFSKAQILWIQQFPIHTTGPLPLWAIPYDKVQEMTQEEATLAILENN